jgi:methionyl-tRNA formyltransferase
MAIGARALSAALPALVSGSLEPRPQQDDGATLAPFPTPDDWTISTLLSAAWAWRFARGVALLGGPLRVVTNDRVIPVADALEWSVDALPDAAVMDAGDGTVLVQFSPGWVRFLLPQ